MAAHYDDDSANLTGRRHSYASSIREPRLSFEFSESGSSAASVDLSQQLPEKHIESRERVSTKTLAYTILLPVLNILITLALIGCILLIYVRANGQPIDYKMGGLSIPTLLSLVITLAVLFIGGGIGYAVSEYKWVRFQSKPGRLALLDAYDACSRGVGGAIRAIPALRMEMVLIITVIFYLGIIAIGPAAQGILHTTTYDNCEKKMSGLLPLNISLEDHSTYEVIYKDPRSIKGVNDYVMIQYGFRQFFNRLPLQMMNSCPTNAINCTFDDLPVPHITADCTMGSLDTKILDIYTNNVTDVRDYYANETLSVSLPAYFYAASMFNRTYYDLNNLTLPYKSTKDSAFDPEARRMVGDQVFVVVSSKDDLKSTMDHIDSAQVRECTLKSFYNHTRLVNTQGQLDTTVVSSKPVDMDYDNVIGNNVFFNEFDSSSDPDNNVIVNSYALQLSFMRALIINEQGIGISLGTIDWTINKVLEELGRHVGLTYTITGPMLMVSPIWSTVCTRTELLYVLDQAAYFPLALCLLIPLIWWVVTWIVSLYKVNGVSRGHSQVSLLVSGLTPAAHDRMRGTIYENQYATMAAAGNLDVKFGEHISDGRLTFGLVEEVDPIGVRRMSF